MFTANFLLILCTKNEIIKLNLLGPWVQQINWLNIPFRPCLSFQQDRTGILGTKNSACPWKNSYFFLISFDLVHRKIASSNTSRLEAHAGFFRLLIKRIFDPYICPVACWQKVDFLISNPSWNSILYFMLIRVCFNWTWT